MNTPYVIVYPNRIKENYKVMYECLEVDKLFYATKPNVENITFQTLAECGANFEIVSSKEMIRLIKLGVDPENIICSVPIKPIEDLKKMYSLGCRYFVYDCIQELNHLKQYCPEAKKILRLSLKSIFCDEIGYGMDIDDVMNLVKNGFIPDGYTFYVLCNNEETRKDIFAKIFDLLDSILHFHSARDVLINIGGNFMNPKLVGDAFFTHINQLIRNIKANYKNTIFYAEPGRAIVQDAFDIVTTVLVKKDDRVYIDAHSQIVKIPPLDVFPFFDEKGTNGIKSVCFNEYLCSNYVLFEKEINFNIQEGMKLILKGCGAYSFCFANRFHSTGYPKIIEEWSL